MIFFLKKLTLEQRKGIAWFVAWPACFAKTVRAATGAVILLDSDRI
jgi:hypothetical protein